MLTIHPCWSSRAVPPYAVAVMIGLAALFALARPASVLAASAPSAPSAPPAITTPPTDESQQEDAIAKDSPRASLAAYLEFCQDGKFAEAAQYLDLLPESAVRGGQLAFRLKAVLDRHAWVDLAQISPLSQGNAEDGLVAFVDEIGKIPGVGGTTEPVRLVRQAKPEGVRWVFSRATVGRIDAWYGRLRDRWLLDHLPPALLRAGPAELVIWQWVAFPVLVLLAFITGRVLTWLTQRLAGTITRRTETEWDDIVLDCLRGPFTLGWALVLFYVVLPWLGLSQPARELVYRLLHVSVLFAFFWTLLRVVRIFKQRVARSAWATSHGPSQALIPLAARFAYVIVFAVALVAVVADLGYPVGSLITGLGIGGLAFALAAQKTVENLFGAFSIGVDQPIREGEFVKIDDVLGTVEAIGLRSTRIRTLDRTVISIPNGKLAEMRLESFAARDRLRLACTLGLVRHTTSQQMREVLAGLERVLREHPKIWPDSIIVRLKQLGASSLDIDIMAWFLTTDGDEFQAIRQEVLLEFMQVVESAGSALAFPTQTVHVVADPGTARQAL